MNLTRRQPASKSEYISVVIPAYNEAASLPYLISRLDEVFDGIGETYELIVVDDGSTDATWEVLTHSKLTRGTLRAIRLSRNFGKEPAISAGLRAVSGAAAIVMDADLQHPPELLPKMIDLWRSGGPLVVNAVKKIRQGESMIRRAGAHIFYFLFRKLTGLDLWHTTDFKLLDRSAVEEYLALPEHGRFFRGLTMWLGYPAVSISFIPQERPPEAGGSRWSINKLLGLARHSLISFTALPLQLVTWCGIITLLLSIVLGLQTLWQKWSGEAVEGFTTVILVQLGIGSVLMISLGLIGEYLARIYEEIKGRPQYIIAEVMDKQNPK
nr:glycosyltransferase [Deltaproteobacteria bacterium]